MNRDLSNPHETFDGPWGGWGDTPTWLCFGDSQDTFEREEKDGKWTWVRMWDDAQKHWREITPDELAKLPSPEPKR